MKVVNACERSGRVCVAAKELIGEDVLKIVDECAVLKVTDKGYFFDANLRRKLEAYFGRVKEEAR